MSKVLKYRVLITLFALAALLTVNSCNCSCRCTKELGCRILEARTVDGDSLIAKKTYCSGETDMWLHMRDIFLEDTISQFIVDFKTFKVNVTVRDSIYFTAPVIDENNCSKCDPYPSQGYNCVNFE